MFDIPSETVEVAVFFLVKRQLQGRPTTLRLLSKRIGLAASRLLDAVEVYGIRYVLVSHEELRGRVARGQNNTEVLLSYMPKDYALRLNIEAERVEESFRSVMGEDPEPVDEFVEAQEKGIEVAEKLDPFSGYRITKDKYEVLKNNLITFEELVQIGREQGYSVAAIRRATGGDRMRYQLPSFFWRPYVLGKKRYYLKDVIDHLPESDRTYKSRGKLDKVRRERIGDPDTNKFIEFSRRKPKSKRDAPRKRKAE